MPRPTTRLAPNPPCSARRPPLDFAVAALALALTAPPAVAQSALTENAPGLGSPRAERPLTERPLVDPRPATPTSPSVSAPTAPESGFAGATDVPATAIIRSLAPFADGNPGAPPDVRPVTPADGDPVRVDFARAIDLTVFFAYDSATLTPEAHAQLDQLAAALQSAELAPHRFLVAGHTDAKGAAPYNLDLSARRALSVGRYLVDRHAIAPARVVAHGFGEERLASPSLPLSGANRRVEVALIVPDEASLRGEGDYAYDLVDPRLALDPYALDDFAGTPTPPAQ